MKRTLIALITLLHCWVGFAFADPVRFIAFGDWGARSTGQFALARQMAHHYQEQPFQFALLLGDNIYPIGDIGKHAQDSFYEPYGPLLRNGVKFYASLGNHDVMAGHGDAQVAFFKMPGRYYSFTQENIQFFVLDTNDFDGKQQNWLKTSLANSRAQWKIVYGHHPVYSSGMHGNTEHLVKHLAPILNQYGVDFYLAGHEHNYERFLPIHHVHYLVSGGGGAYVRPFKKIKPLSVRRLSEYHFLRFDVDGHLLKMSAINPEGTVIDTLEVAKGQK